MKLLIIINSVPYDTEHAYNALRIAIQFRKEFPGSEIRIYLIADGAFCAVPKEQTPNDFYNIERMLQGIIHDGGRVKMCTSCGEARGLREIKITEGVEWSSMKALVEWVADSDKVINY